MTISLTVQQVAARPPRVPDNLAYLPLVPEDLLSSNYESSRGKLILPPSRLLLDCRHFFFR